MKRLVCFLGAIAAVSGLCEPKPLKAVWFDRTISPEVGTPVAGYGSHDVSVSKYDDLKLVGLGLRYGGETSLILTYDLLGLDAETIRRIRRACAQELKIGEERVLLNCTHTHGGPHARKYVGSTVFGRKPDPYARPDSIDAPYVERLVKESLAAVSELKDDARWRDCLVGFGSTTCDVNRNRRFTTPDNCASFIAHRRALHGIATGIADKELGTVVLLEPGTMMPLFVLGNYAAHPLAIHSPGNGGLRITADFPGFYRRYVANETGGAAMFMQGACGDLVPTDDELGIAAARKVGEELGMRSLASVIDIQRNTQRFVIAEPRLSAAIRTLTVPLRGNWRRVLGRESETLEVQCLSVGDIAFVGVPGEIVNEVGLEIKWHSPFKRTFIAYGATDYFGYISPPNFIAAGGYEAQSQHFASREVLSLVKTASDALFEMRERTFPEDGDKTDAYPDNLNLPLVNLPGGVKESKWQR